MLNNYIYKLQAIRIVDQVTKKESTYNFIAKVYDNLESLSQDATETMVVRFVRFIEFLKHIFNNDKIICAFRHRW